MIRRALALVLALALLAPFTLDTGRADSGGVQVAALQLDLREPVLLSCDFSLDGFRACPPRFGAFTGERQFVCSGEAARGVLYGTLGGSPRVILVSYVEDRIPAVEHLLAEIRDRVDVMNDRRNMLKQAKARRGPAPADDTGLPAWFWDPAPGPAPASSFTELAALLPDFPGGVEPVSARLAARAEATARLKDLYYSAQEARIDLLAAQFNLQLALAQSPGQEIPGLLVLGGGDAAREAMQTETGRLTEAWRERHSDLESQVNRDRSWLRAERTARPPSGWGVFSFLPSLNDLEAKFERAPSAGADSPARRLEQAYREARLTIAEAELAAIESGLARLEELGLRVDQGLPATRVSRRVVLSSAAFSRPELEELPGYSAVSQIVRRGEIEQLWAQLAAEFAGIEDGPDHGAAPGGIPEVLYCLAAGDIAAHLQPDAPVPAATDAVPADQISVPAAGAYEGFIEFARWYSSAVLARAE
jgi:hypothetical protein